MTSRSSKLVPESASVVTRACPTTLSAEETGRCNASTRSALRRGGTPSAAARARVPLSVTMSPSSRRSGATRSSACQAAICRKSGSTARSTSSAWKPPRSSPAFSRPRKGASAMAGFGLGEQRRAVLLQSSELALAEAKLLEGEFLELLLEPEAPAPIERCGKRQFLEIGIDGGKVEQQVAEVLARRCVNALQFVDEGFVQGGGRRKISEELPGVRTRRVGE